MGGDALIGRPLLPTHGLCRARTDAIARGLIDPNSWDRGIRDLHRTTEGVYCYTFFKAVATA